MDHKQAMLETLAKRIERAYGQRRPHWNPGCSAPGVWVAAAAVLKRIHESDRTFPIDPELYVAAQFGTRTPVDPWAELTQPSSSERYRRRVRTIIAGLRAELRAEIRLANRRIRRGESIGAVVLTKSRSLSPLGCFIVALHARRDDLVERLRSGAVNQHRSCPLYRPASLPLLPSDSYPQLNEELKTATSLANPHAVWN